MLALTGSQPPTRLGKEIAVFVERLEEQMRYSIFRLQLSLVEQQEIITHIMWRILKLTGDSLR
jgi:hypothetical protein